MEKCNKCLQIIPFFLRSEATIHVLVPALIALKQKAVLGIWALSIKDNKYNSTKIIQPTNGGLDPARAEVLLCPTKLGTADTQHQSRNAEYPPGLDSGLSRKSGRKQWIQVPPSSDETKTAPKLSPFAFSLLAAGISSEELPRHLGSELFPFGSWQQGTHVI